MLADGIAMRPEVMREVRNVQAPLRYHFVRGRCPFLAAILLVYLNSSYYARLWRQAPEDRAISLARKYVPPESTAPIEDSIKQWLKAKKGVLRVYGWNAKKIDDQTQLVGCTYDEGPGSRSNS